MPFTMGLRPLCNNEYMDEMWPNMDRNEKNFSTIFFQDTDNVWTEEDYEDRKPPSYRLPAMFPPMTRKFDMDYYLDTAIRYRLQDVELGRKMVGDQEIRGFRPYITFERSARNINPDIIVLAETIVRFSRSA